MRHAFWVLIVQCKALAPFPKFDPKKPNESSVAARAFHTAMECVCVVWNAFLAVFSTIGAYHFLRYAYTGLVVQQCTLTQLLSEQCAGLGGFRTDATLSWWAVLFLLSKVVEFGDTWLYCFQKGKDHLYLHWCGQRGVFSRTVLAILI